MAAKAKAVLVTLVLAAHAHGWQARAQAAAQADPHSPFMLDVGPVEPSGLTDQVIRKAVRETVAEVPQSAPIATSRDTTASGAFSATRSSRIMSAAFDEAKVPDCLHGDALRHQPAKIGFIGVAGPYSLPWVIAAALRGKCN